MIFTFPKAITIPPVWDTALQAIQNQAPGAIIAGGALRDLVFGGSIKDLDVFVPAHESRGELQPFAGSNFQQTLFSVEYDIKAREEVVGCQEFHVPGVAEPVQVVHMNSPSDLEFAEFVLRRMDFDACQIGFDGHDILCTLAFLRAVETRTWSIMNCENATQAQRSLRRAERFMERYPTIPFDTTIARVVLLGTGTESAQ